MSITGSRILRLATATCLVLGASRVAVPALSAGPPHPPTTCPADEALTSGTIATVAGTGSSIDSGDGGPATEAGLSVTLGTVAVDGDGNLFLGSWYSPTIRRVATDGTITTFAGPDTGAPFVQLGGLAFDDAGNLYATDHEASRVWRVDPAGVIEAVVGTGVPGATGDGGPALEAQINADNIGVSPSGQIYLNDVNLYRTVTTAGNIERFAGTGETGFSGDGGPAISATFVEAIGVTPDRSGNLFLVDTGNQRIRKVDPQGTITTVAGSGEKGHAGDGGPALDAALNDPVMIAIDERDGSLYFTEHHGYVVRQVRPDGTIATVAGTGVAGFSGDCGPATEARINQPWGIAIHDGVLYIADMGNNRIRVIVL